MRLVVWDGPRSEHPRCRHTRVARNHAGHQPLRADAYPLVPPTVNVRPRPRVAERLPRMRARHATAPLVAAFAKYSQRTELGLGGVTAPDRWWLQRVAIPEAAAAARVSTGSEHSEASWSNQQAAARRRTRRPAQIRHATGQMERPSRVLEPCETWMAQAGWHRHGDRFGKCTGCCRHCRLLCAA